MKSRSRPAKTRRATAARSKSLVVQIDNSQRRWKVDPKRLRTAIQAVLAGEGIRKASVSLAVVDDRTIHELNRRYLKHDEPTDVISFLLDQADGIVDGQIVVSADTAAATAERYGWTARRRIVAVRGSRHIASGGFRRSNSASFSAPCGGANSTIWANLDCGRNTANVSPRQGKKSSAMTSVTLFWLTLAALAVASFAAIGVHVLREFSRSQVREILREQNRLPRFDEILNQHQRAALGAESLRVIASIVAAIAATASYWISSATESSWTWSLPMIVGYAVVGVFLFWLAIIWIPMCVGRIWADAILIRTWPFWRAIGKLAIPSVLGAARWSKSSMVFRARR